MDAIELEKEGLLVRRFNFESLSMAGIALPECTFSEPVFTSVAEFSVVAKL